MERWAVARISEAEEIHDRPNDFEQNFDISPERRILDDGCLFVVFELFRGIFFARYTRKQNVLHDKQPM
jgi:hypothetical protein